MAKLHTYTYPTYMGNIGKYISATVYIVVGPFSPLPIELSVYLANGTNFSIMRTMMLMNKALEYSWESARRRIESDIRDMSAIHNLNYLILIKILILPAACMKTIAYFQAAGI